MRQLILSALAGATAIGSAGTLQAQEYPVVVELYTSQGCSSCPPADEMVEALLMMPDVIPLALHVDYWDYIGWPDQFADPAYTERQRNYARRANARSVYTPQFVIGGTEFVIGAHSDQLQAHIREKADDVSSVVLTVQRNGQTINISATARASFAEPLNVQVVRYTPKETVSIKRGENRGKTIDYYNIVTDWDHVVDWAGSEALLESVTLEGSDPAVVILQEAKQGPIVAAARVE